MLDMIDKEKKVPILNEALEDGRQSHDQQNRTKIKRNKRIKESSAGLKCQKWYII